MQQRRQLKELFVKYPSLALQVFKRVCIFH